MVRGSTWMVAMRWAMRAIGLVSTVILARLLSPEDFGVVAMALVVVGFLEIMTWTGVDLALIRDAQATREHYDTAWTLQVGQGALLALMLLLVAPLADIYFNEPRAVAVIQWLALKAFLEGLENIGTVAFRKDLDFAREFRFGVLKKVLTFAIVVACAFTLHSYWALVVGMIFGAAVGVVLSFLMHPYRPRLSVARLGDIWSFSQWLLLSRIGFFLNRRSDQFIIGRVGGPLAMGNYFIGYELGTMFANDFVMPMRRALFPSYAKLQDDPERFAAAVLNMLGVLALLCLAVGFGLSAVAEGFVLVVFGEKWRAAVPFLEWLALYGAVSGLASALEVVLLVTGRGRLSALEAWGQLLVLVPATLWAYGLWGVEAIPVARTLVSLAFLPVMMGLVTRACPVSLAAMAAVLWRPTLAGLGMYLGVRGLHLDLGLPPLSLALDVITGTGLYIGLTWLLWRIAGRPPGPEQAALDYLRAGVARLRRGADPRP